MEELCGDNERKPLRTEPSQAPDAIKRIRFDTIIGVFFSNLVAFLIILTAAAVLHAHGRTEINSSAEAAAALRPVAGRFAFVLFGLGIIGTRMLALPVLAGATAYAMAESWRKPYGLERKPREARFFTV